MYKLYKEKKPCIIFFPWEVEQLIFNMKCLIFKYIII